jgi:hypothetical protein
MKKPLKLCLALVGSYAAAVLVAYYFAVNLTWPELHVFGC